MAKIWTRRHLPPKPQTPIRKAKRPQKFLAETIYHDNVKH